MKLSRRLLFAVSLAAVQAAFAAVAAEPLDLPDGKKLDLRRGMRVYKANCASCHASGKQGAPRLRDRAAWKDRSFQSISTLEQHAKKGFLQMPAKGERALLSDEEVADAVYYMSSQIGDRMESGKPEKKSGR